MERASTWQVARTLLVLRGPWVPELDSRRGNELKQERVLWLLAAIALVALVGWDFATATTFLSDDYIFRLFGRLESNPLLAFVSDKHGGEYYRPIPMLLWWLVERLSGGQAWAFALAAFVLHASCAVLLGVMGRRLGLAGRSAILAGVLFFVAPGQREAALWFSASTDLLACAATLGSVAAFLVGGRRGQTASVLLAALAFFSKETALVLPGLLVAAAWFTSVRSGGRRSFKMCLLAVLPHVGAACVYLLARTLVLRGLGGAADPVAPWFAQGLQLAAGLAHTVTAYAPLPEWLALVSGGVLLGVVGFVAWRRDRLARFALLWTGVALLPLPAAGWVVGARYFYLPAAGVFLLAAIALESASRLVAGTAVVWLAFLGLLSGGHRAEEVTLYRKAVAAANAAVRDGLARGHRVFLVRGGVKDLDLAIKLADDLPTPATAFVVIPDVPASFLWMPVSLAERLHFVVAEPSLPPAGAYRFGNERIVGQARRDEAPDLDEVLTRLPELRIIHVIRKGHDFIWEDRTDVYRPTHSQGG